MADLAVDLAVALGDSAQDLEDGRFHLVSVHLVVDSVHGPAILHGALAHSLAGGEETTAQLVIGQAGALDRGPRMRHGLLGLVIEALLDFLVLRH